MAGNVSPATTSDEALPRPRRRMRWWGWLLVVLGTLLCVAAGTWYGWGRVGQGRLNDMLAEIRSRGEPVAWMDFAEPPVPEEQNAVPLYLKARDQQFQANGKYTQAQADDLREMLADLVRNPTFRREHRAEVAAIGELGRESLELLARAAERTGADFKVDYRKPAFDVVVPVGNVLNLSEAAGLAALGAHEDGRDGEALARIRQAMALARCMGRQPMLISQYISMACYHRAMPALEQSLPGLRIGPEPAATAAHVRQLIAELLDTAPAAREWARGWMTERAFAHDTIERLRAGEFSLSDLRGWGRGGRRSETSWTWLIEPMLTWDELTCLQFHTSLVEAAKQPTYPAAVRKLGEGPDSYDAIRSRCKDSRLAALHPITVMLLPGIEMSGHHEDIALRRMAAVALAMRLHEVEKGKPVTALADLVAAGYLPAVPADPFSDKGEPIRHKADPKQPLLYSVGRNGRDDGGAFTLEADGGVDTNSPDIVFFLKGDRPAGKVRWTPLRIPGTTRGK